MPKTPRRILETNFQGSAMTDHPSYEPPLSRSSRRLLQLSLITPRPCQCGGCICLTRPERRALKRVSKIARKWRRQERRRARALAQARDEARS
jgi:hypothetical protein